MIEDFALYRPSNGTEGTYFMAEWCNRCQKDSEEQPCGILMLTMCRYENEEDYPPEWHYRDGKPVCSAFELREEEK